MFPRFNSNYRFSGRTQHQTSKAFSNTAGNASGNMRRGGQFRSMEGSRIFPLNCCNLILSGFCLVISVRVLDYDG